jgi:hypothetical protein
MPTCAAAISRVGQLILELLRELSDENAYQRHLECHGRMHSPEEWRRFSDERMREKYARAKCC